MKVIVDILETVFECLPFKSLYKHRLGALKQKPELWSKLLL